MRRPLVLTALLPALLAGSLAGCSDDASPTSWAEGSSPAASAPAAPSPAATEDTAGTAKKEAAPVPSRVKTAAPGSAWKPCGNDCEDVFEDTCDGLYAAGEQSRGALLDLMIANEFQIDTGRLADCPRFAKDWKVAQSGFGEGTLKVGTDVEPGKYVTTGHLSKKPVLECFWERRGAGSAVVASDQVTRESRVTVTIAAGDTTFTSQGCGNWIPA